jgi:DNA-binding beta-propeller fold protein YncE
MTLNTLLARAAASAAFALLASAAFAAPPLIAHAPIIVPGGPGGFDWMLVDRTQNRLYASHGATKTLTVLDLNTQAVRQIPTGDVAGIAVDTPDGKVFAGGGDQKVVVLNNQTLAKIGEIALTGPVDDIKFDPKNRMIYADHDDGNEVWVIDAKTEKLVGSITIAGAPEEMAYDLAADTLYQNIKPADCVDVINPATGKVTATWSTVPARSPHGLALDPLTGRLFSAGGNGQLAVLDIKTGKVIASTAIAPKTDQIAFDPKNKRIYCASHGFISVVQETADGVRPLGDVPSPTGAHTLAVDPTTGDVWVCYTDASSSYLERFTTK